MHLAVFSNNSSFSFLPSSSLPHALPLTCFFSALSLLLLALLFLPLGFLHFLLRLKTYENPWFFLTFALAPPRPPRCFSLALPDLSSAPVRLPVFQPCGAHGFSNCALASACLLVAFYRQPLKGIEKPFRFCFFLPHVVSLDDVASFWLLLCPFCSAPSAFSLSLNV